MGLAALTLNYHPSVLDAHVAAMERASGPSERRCIDRRRALGARLKIEPCMLGERIRHPQR